MRTVCRELGFTVPQYLRRTLLPALAPLALMVAAVLVVRHLLHGMHGYLDLFYAATAGGTVYLLAYVLVGLTRDDRQLLASYLKISRKRLDSV